MAWRYRKRLKVLPGVYFNLSKSGVSTSIGVRGASINIGNSGIRSTLGVPGTGLSYSKKITTSQPSSNKKEDFENTLRTAIENGIRNAAERAEKFRKAMEDTATAERMALRSRPVRRYTSQTMLPFLLELEQARNDEKAQKMEIAQGENRIADLSSERAEIQKSVFGRLTKKNRLLEIDEEIINVSADLDVAREDNLGWSVRVETDAIDETRDALNAVYAAFSKLINSELKFDVLSRTETSAVKSEIKAKNTTDPVALGVSDLQAIDSVHKAIHFENADGGDIYIYPAFVAIQNLVGDLAIVDLGEIEIVFEKCEIAMPNTVRDSRLTKKIWEKANKDGSRDMRYQDNREFLVYEMGQITISSKTGLREVYLFSDCAAAQDFCGSFTHYCATLELKDEAIKEP